MLARLTVDDVFELPVVLGLPRTAGRFGLTVTSSEQPANGRSSHSGSDRRVRALSKFRQDDPGRKPDSRARLTVDDVFELPVVFGLPVVSG